MRIPLLGLGLLLFLPACHVTPPEFPVHEVPAGPFIEKLAERRESFEGMKAVARVEIERKGRKRAYESVAVLQKGFRKLKVEAYGPLGQPLVALLWDGTSVLVRKAGEADPLNVGQFGLERVLGLQVVPADLCALLTGNAPAVPGGAVARAGCNDDDRCVVDFQHDDLRWRVLFLPSTGDPATDPAVAGADLYQGDRLVLRSTYEPQGWSPARGLPKRITVEDPVRMVRLTVDYEEADSNVPVEDGIFALSPEEEQAK
jgi:outer membrane lipoprotein-sorting protein